MSHIEVIIILLLIIYEVMQNQYLWDYFVDHFDSNNPCTFTLHMLCKWSFATWTKFIVYLYTGKDNYVPYMDS